MGTPVHRHAIVDNTDSVGCGSRTDTGKIAMDWLEKRGSIQTLPIHLWQVTLQRVVILAYHRFSQVVMQGWNYMDYFPDFSGDIQPVICVQGIRGLTLVKESCPTISRLILLVQARFISKIDNLSGGQVIFHGAGWFSGIGRDLQSPDQTRYGLQSTARSRSTRVASHFHCRHLA